MTLQYPKAIKWWHSIVGILILTTSVGVGASMFMLQSPPSPDCLSESLLQDSASLVIYCASTSVDEQDADKLSNAIQRVNTVPSDNPLRQTADGLIEKWSQALFDLSKKSFHEGDLSKAVDTAKLIPVNVPIYDSANKQIKLWQSTWSKAQAIYDVVESDIEENDYSRWSKALSKAKELKNLDNDYWAITKYEELTYKIEEAKDKHEQEEQKKANEKKIAENQDSISNSQTTESLYSNISSEAEQETEDLARIKKARTWASSEKVEDIRNAINEASLVVSEAHYQEAKKIISTLESKMEMAEDKDYLEQAKKSANKNDVTSLETAISKASLISQSRPLYKEANQHILIWSQRISQLKNQPKSKKTKTNETTPRKTAINFKRQLNNSNYLQTNPELKLRVLQENQENAEVTPYIFESQANDINLNDMQLNDFQE
ncbi:MAG: hypothetical protein KME64_12720 [Scytonematopsis contorta HA4267-MV1]|jgi:hypothetical protein|nr:hypothetical protein [Scytonematopsis contorta HA4267-MV1]